MSGGNSGSREPNPQAVSALSGFDPGREPDWCDDCHAHIIPMGNFELALSWICWWLAMHWPDRLFVNRAHLAILPWAGNIAYRCVCWRERAAGRQKEQSA